MTDAFICDNIRTAIGCHGRARSSDRAGNPSMVPHITRSQRGAIAR